MESITTHKSRIPEELRPLVQGNTYFALQQYRCLLAMQGNMFFSPLALTLALAMAYAGARGKTEAQMASVMGFNLDENFSNDVIDHQDRLHTALAELQGYLNTLGHGNARLFLANSIWPQANYPFLDSFTHTLKVNYQTEPLTVDYVWANEKARTSINNWVAMRTHGKILDLIPPGLLNDLTRLLLVSALYFKGEWLHPFDAWLTQEAPFYLSPENHIPIQMMKLSGNLNYAHIDQAQILELPYAGGSWSMVVILPDQIDGLPTLQQSVLDPGKLEIWLESVADTNVQVSLPRFKLTGNLRLDKLLIQLGMQDAFDPDRADFSGINGKAHWLFIQAVLHQAMIEVNEEGSEAAAASAVVLSLRAMPSRPVVFCADHPFLFLIREKQTGSILFLGRLSEPIGTPG